MAKKRSNRALGLDPLDDLEDIADTIWEKIEPDATPEESKTAAEPTIAALERMDQVEEVEIQPTPGQFETQVEKETAQDSTADLPTELGVGETPPMPEWVDIQAETEVVEQCSAAIEPSAQVEASESQPTLDRAEAQAGKESAEAAAEPDKESSDLLDELIATIDQEIDQTLALETEADPASTAEVRAEDAATAEDAEQYVIFSLSGTEYAVPIANVIEIGQPLNITPVPNVPDWLPGVANLRGEIISMVDLRAFLGMERAGYRQASRMLVAQASQEDMTTGLVVDRVSGIRYLSADRIGEPTAPIEDQVTPYLDGVYEHEERLLVVLNLDRLLLSPEMQQFEPA
jgi:purine-binding chemotaxis protein CheW